MSENYSHQELSFDKLAKLLQKKLDEKPTFKQIIIEKLEVRLASGLEQLKSELPYPPGEDEKALHDGIESAYKELQYHLAILEES